MEKAICGRWRDRGFTLIELLVVMAIIAILAGISLGAISRSRATALSTACKSMLRQYQLATEAYANDYADYYPDARTHLNVNGGILTYFSVGQEVWPENVSRCPGDRKTEELGRLGTFALYDDCKVSIGCSENAMSDSARMTMLGPMAFWRKRSMFSFSPSNRMTWADWQNNPFDPAPTAAMVKPATATTMGSLCFRHPGNSSNAAFADGHVGVMRLVGIKASNGGHDLAPGSNWGITGSIGQQYKMYTPFGPPPENTGETTIEKRFPTISID
jgi:prepilin-type N-terminal cleavage/methylation domain-containing protein/prepilin-type processing-associated H-X9-DG protein